MTAGKVKGFHRSAVAIQTFCFSVLVLFLPVLMHGQSRDTVRVNAIVIDEVTKHPVSNLMVVNMRTQEGGFIPTGGKISMTIFKTDTFIVACNGYNTIKLSLKDSVLRNEYNFRIILKHLEVDLQPVEIFTQRDLEEIQKDIETLGYDEHDYMLNGVDAFSSPITALYQQFSRRERNKRMVAEMRNNDKRRALLKELFRKYVDNDIIDLRDEEFDEFIDFCKVSDEFLKSSTQYEFIMYIKKRYEVYRMINE